MSVGQVISGILGGGLALLGIYAAALRIYYLLDRRIDRAEIALASHAQSLEKHGLRMESHETRTSERMVAHEARMIDVMQDVAKVVGACAALQTRRPGEERRRCNPA